MFLSRFEFLLCINRCLGSIGADKCRKGNENAGKKASPVLQTTTPSFSYVGFKVHFAPCGCTMPMSAKHILAKVLLLLYLSAVCRPVLPVLADGLAHILWYDRHVQTVHAHNGQSHVHYEVLSALSDDGHNDKHSSSAPSQSFKCNDFLSAHLIGIVAAPPTWPVLVCIRQGLLFFLVFTGTDCIEVPVPPPNSPSALQATLHDVPFQMTCRV